jgi:hypothetical protein
VSSHVAARKEYSQLLRSMVALKKRAAHVRKRMIGRNRHHDDEVKEVRWTDAQRKLLYDLMPADMKRWHRRLRRTPMGRMALEIHEKFWGVPYPVEIRVTKLKGGGRREKALAGLGDSPVAYLSETPRGKPRKVKGKWSLVLDVDSGRLALMNPRRRKPMGRNMQFVGYAPRTDYVPTRALEKAGTFKAGRYWMHMHTDDGGRPPEVYLDDAGNLIYGSGTYSVDKWLRR